MGYMFVKRWEVLAVLNRTMAEYATMPDHSDLSPQHIINVLAKVEDEILELSSCEVDE